ncbi:MAG: protein kinase [Deltaproteobacteria bacterium]|nr:protein kinase [Deltaproteobacteria bacterium]
MTNARYRLVHKLGVGGMAEVFLAQQRGLAGFEKLVVIKRVLPQLRQDSGFVNMLLAEARLAAGLRHPNIVEIYDVHRDEGDFFIVMEYLAGEDLRLMLATARKAGFRFPVGVAGRIISDASAGLDFAHRAVDADGRPLGVVHRDIGPTNIILTYHGISKVLDFGVAKANIHNIYTRPGTLKGKYGYASPEQVQHRALDARSDIFSLGIVLHELLTGQRLFRGKTPPETLKAVMEAPIVPPSRINPEVPPALDELVARALERDRNRRLSSAGELQEQLEHILEQNDLLLSAHQVASWVSAHFAEAKARRAGLERSVAADHTQAPQGPVMALPPATTPLPSSVSDISHLSHLSNPSAPWAGSQQGHGSWPISAVSAAQPPPPPPPSGRKVAWVVLLTSLLTVLVVALVGFAFYLGRNDGSTQVEVVRPPESAAPTKVALHLHVVPAGAQLSVDDTPWPHPVGEDGVLVPLNAGQQVNLRLEKDGYETVRRAMKGPAGGTENVYVTLVRHAPAPAVIDAGAVAESAPSTPPASARGRVTAAARSTSRSSRSSAPQQGNLEVAFIPAEARLFVDDQLQPGSSPRRVSGLSEGRHRLRLEAAGYVAQTREVEVEGGKTASVWFSLERAQAEQARLDVMSSPVGAEVRVDGKVRGRSPVVGLMLASGVAHKVELSLDGYKPWQATVEPTPGANPPIQATLSPAAAAPAGVAAPAPVAAASEAREITVPGGATGDADAGRGLFKDKCRSCHGSSASALAPARYTADQWSRYFARGRHRRHGALAEQFSLAELTDVKSFLMANAADVESDTAAGVR